MGQTALQFGEEHSHGSSAIWSCKFSADGNEIFAGGPGPIYGMRQDKYVPLKTGLSLGFQSTT